MFLEEGVALHLHLLDLQLVHLAQQRQNLALLLSADALRQLLHIKCKETQHYGHVEVRFLLIN